MRKPGSRLVCSGVSCGAGVGAAGRARGRRGRALQPAQVVLPVAADRQAAVIVHQVCFIDVARAAVPCSRRALLAELGDVGAEAVLEHGVLRVAVGEELLRRQRLPERGLAPRPDIGLDDAVAAERAAVLGRDADGLVRVLAIAALDAADGVHARGPEGLVIRSEGTSLRGRYPRLRRVFLADPRAASDQARDVVAPHQRVLGVSARPRHGRRARHRSGRGRADRCRHGRCRRHLRPR